ncbi:MAG: 4a-hydroxytetrahydrobiopterin dehydratase [Pyrinomonadaceae bacterium]
MNRNRLSEEEIAERMSTVAGWSVEGNSLKRRFEFMNFAASLEFVNKAGSIAEEMDHHPDITFGWGYAEFVLTTHDRGGLTEFDFECARRISFEF